MANKTNWTDEQRRAIEARGHTILVSAAAGSGKTAVLTERAVRRMLDADAPIDADRLLVVTFTRAAAQEMKQRMLLKLTEYIAEHPLDASARRQRQLLDRAVIGTIDSLCLNLLRENWQLLGLPAAFRVGDAQELDAMREQAVDAALEAAYADRDDAAFGALAELLSQKRGDQSLAGTVLRVLDFARTHPFYINWLDEKLKVYEHCADPAKSVWGKILLQYAAETAKRCLSDAKIAVEELRDEPDFASYLPAFEADTMLFEALCPMLEHGAWDEASDLLRGYRAVPLKAAKRSACAERKMQLQRLRTRQKDVIETLQAKVLSANLADFSEDVADLLPKLRRLFALVKDTDSRLLSQKCASGIFDFSDLAQFAASLLMARDEQGALHKTPLAQTIGWRFDEIMVDEYQDVNAVQDMIVTALSNGKNLFLVGDVKQSIYRFRQAQPEIFLHRSEEYAQNSAPHEPELITLSGNFRSRNEITQAVNRVFEPLFSKRVGDLFYDAGHRLNALVAYPPVDGAGMQFHLLEQGSLNAGDAAEAEALYAAGEIKRLLDSGAPVTDHGVLRPVRAGDIAILLRSPKAQADIFRRALEQVGIEAFAQIESGFLDSFEITAVMNLLRALDNPTLDIELIGAMLSPMFGFDDDALARIRLLVPSGHFYPAVKKAAEVDARARAFLNIFEHLRRRALMTSAAELITESVETTGFDLLCRAMQGGRQRFANLLLLSQYAEQYHQNGHRGLSAFLKLIDRALQSGDLAPAYVGEQTNAVFITSIHKSKGLEWPVVFLCQAGRDHSFYRNDLIRSTLLHSELGFACVRRDPALKQQFVTVPLEAVRIESERAMLSEELRILYVAATRAKERLIVTAAMKKALETAEALSPDGSVPGPAQVRECQNYAEWLMLALGCYGDAAHSLRLGNTLGQIGLHFSFLEEQNQTDTLPQTGQDAQQSLFDVASVVLPPADTALAAALSKRLAFAYPFAKATKTPSKLAVSQLTHPESGEFRFAKKPAFTLGSASSGSERGTAVHAFMQYCDYSAAQKDVTAEVARLSNAGILSKRQAELVELDKIERFFQSGLAQRVFAADEVLREFAFMVSAAACASTVELTAENNEAPMLQGIADCILIEQDHAVVIDYKTDYVKNAQILHERYAPQLSLYREMLASVLPVPVTECIIWSFALDCEIEI
ncbi:MAG TPA: helicase-exonuclease AddAB subunit AddA [Clostridia bacterium]|nr:helicase-exonuclease AddAB subunit AddA [Clostridia bacterium]